MIHGRLPKLCGHFTKRPRLAAVEGVKLSGYIRIDHGNLIRSSRKTGKAAGVIVGVAVPQRMFLPAVMVLNNDAGQTFRVVVPSDTPLKLVVRSQVVQFADDQGRALAVKDPPQLLQVSPGPAVGDSVQGEGLTEIDRKSNGRRPSRGGNQSCHLSSSPY